MSEYFTIYQIGYVSTNKFSYQMNLPTQLGYFKKLAIEMEQKLGHEESKNILRRSVYLFSSGGNDYLNFNNKNTNPTVSKQIELVGRVMTNLLSTIEVNFILNAICL